MKSLTILVIILFTFLILSCAKTDTSGDQQKTETDTAPAMTTDSLQADSSAADLNKSTEELKKQAEEVEKEVDDLLE